MVLAGSKVSKGGNYLAHAEYFHGNDSNVCKNASYYRLTELV